MCGVGEIVGGGDGPELIGSPEAIVQVEERKVWCDKLVTRGVYDLQELKASKRRLLKKNSN